VDTAQIEAVRRLTAVAARQHGAFTRQQAFEAGFLRGTIGHRLETGVWVAVDHGVYTTGGTPMSWCLRLSAACLAGPAVASHRAAAALWGIPTFDEEWIEVTALRHLRRHSADVLWHESWHLDARYVTALDGIAVTRPARTIVDLGAVVDVERLVAAYDDLARRRLISHASVCRDLEDLGSRRIGSGTVRRALALRAPSDPVPESVLESEFDEIARAAGLPRPVRQFVLLDADGRFIARLDFAFPEQRVGVEIDGLRYHDADADRIRDLQASGVGWHIVRASSADVRHRPDLVVDAIRGALGRDVRI
jgi:hypothetical protein